MRKHHIRSLWLLLLLLTCSVAVWARGSSVTGRVSDEKGKLSIGVSVQEKDTTNNTVTGMNSQYTLKLSAGNPVLLISYIEYKPQEVKVAKQKIVDVVLAEDVSSLNEVVVVGYGNQRKVSVVGAQSTMDMKDIKMPATSLSSATSGHIVGVVAIQRSGEPGHDESNIWIRDLSSLPGQSSSPLVLIDEVERSPSNIGPEGIESFTVLRDASAAAVYGIRDANGVVIMKTEPGKVDKPRFSADYYESFTRLTKKVDMADAYTYMDARNEAQINANSTLKYSIAYIEVTKKANGLLPNDNPRLYNPYLYPATDWTDNLFNNWGRNHRGSVNICGGVPNVNYYTSLSYYEGAGMTRNFRLENYNTQMRYDRYNFTSNLSLKPTSETAADLGFSGYLGQEHYPQSSTSSLYVACMNVNPVIHPLLLPNGTMSGINSQQKFNPCGLLTRGGYYNEFSSQLNSNIRVKQDLDFWKWSKGLSASAMVAPGTCNPRKRKRNRNEPMYTFADKVDESEIWIEGALFGEETGDYFYSVLKEADDSLSLQTPEQWSSRAVYTEASLNYDRGFGAHRVGDLLLYNQKAYWDLSTTNAISGMPYEQHDFAGCATYSWNDRYFTELSLGVDGSENFSPGKCYGVFPAFGLEWAVSSESFWNPAHKYVSFLEFRYTDEWVGSDTAADRRFMYQGVFTGLTGIMFGTSYASISSYGREKYGINIAWSKSRKQGLGIDIRFLNDNLSFVVDFFRERHDNIFLQRNIIPNYAEWIENPYANLGVVENKGIELVMDYTRWLGEKTFPMVRGSLTFNRDKIIENGEPPVDYPRMETRGTNVNATWGFIADGLFTSQAEVEGHATQFGTIYIGGIKYRDLNEGGVVDNYGKTVVRRGDVPRVYYGFGTDLQIGDFSINALFQGTGRADRYLDSICTKPFQDDEGRDSVFANVRDRRSPGDPTNQDMFYPRAYVGSDANTNNVRKSSWQVKDANFLRLKQLNVSYSMPKKLLGRCLLKSANVYLMGTNLFTLSNFKLQDPELNSSDGTAYPNVSSYSVGVKFSFQP